MAKFVFVLAFLLTIAAVETASAGPSFCTVDDDAEWTCTNNTYYGGPA
jgi:hypothetical protein